jgi:hypothetical protein
MMRQFSGADTDPETSSLPPRIDGSAVSARFVAPALHPLAECAATFRPSILNMLPAITRRSRSPAERRLETRARVLFALAGLVVFGLPILYVGMFAPGSAGWQMTLAVAGLFICPLLAVIAIAESIVLIWCRLGSASDRKSNALPAFRFHLRRLGAYAISVVVVLALARAGESLWRATH